MLDNNTENVKVATKLAKSTWRIPLPPREELLKHGVKSLATLRNTHEDMKKSVALNINLAQKNTNLRQELNHARMYAWVLRKEALLTN